MLDLLRHALEDLGRRWQPLFLTDLLFKLIAVVALTPLVALAFRGFISLSGQNLLADVDLLHFLLTPLGLVCAVLVGAMWLAIVALEMAALIGVLGSGPGKTYPVLNAVRFAAFNAWPVLRLTARIVVKTLLIAAPFLAIAALVYWSWLTEFDINYYLQQRPPVFRRALLVGVVLALALATALIYAASGWLLALPLVLFEDIPPRQALRLSVERTRGSRWRLLMAITLWAVTMFVLSSVVTGGVLMIGRAIVDRPYTSLSFLTFAIGSVLLVSGLINLIINLIGTTTFASLLFHSYRQFGNPEEDKITRLWHLTSDRSEAQIRITTFRIAAAAIACILFAALIGWWSARDMRLDNNIEIIAHRGASAFAPENTLAAVRAAIDQNADWVEIDVQETADGEVVVFHDSDFMKLAGLNRKIWEVDAEELSEIDVGSRFGDDFKTERVPTLAQVLKMCKGKAGVNIELKYYGHDQQLEQRVIDLVESHEMSDQVIFISLKNESVKKMKSLRPDCEAGLLLSVLVGNRANLEADFLAINANFATRSMVRKTHEQGKKVFVWTVNDPVTMATMIGRGVDGLITDKPGLARTVVYERASLNAAERLMLEFTELFGITPEIADQ